MDTISDRIRQIVQQELGVPAHDIASDATLEELGADSLDRASLTLALEDAFGIDIPDQEGRALRTVREVVAYVEGALPGAAGAQRTF